MTTRQKPSPVSKRRRAAPAEALSPEAVAAWLRQHPDFLSKNPDLLLALTPPDLQSGEAVIDFQRFVVERQRRELEKLKASSQELLAVSRINKSMQQSVHRAVLALLAANSFERAVATVTDDWAAFLNLDVVVIGVEGQGSSPLSALKNGLTMLSPGEVDSRLGRAQDVRVFPELKPIDPALFGEAAALAKSAAWMRLTIHPDAPTGVLALGSRDVGRFHQRQNTEHLRFLASVLGTTIRAWLDLPLPSTDHPPLV